MQRSKAIEQAWRDICGAFSARDMEKVGRLLTSDSEMLGTAPGERWVGPEIASHYGEVLAMMGPNFTVIAGTPSGFENGDTGWFTDLDFAFGIDGNSIPARVTGVFVREDGQWKLAQSHFAVPVADEDVGFVLESN